MRSSITINENFHGGIIVQTCSQCNTQSPDKSSNCSNCNADLKEYSTTAIALKRFKDNPRVRDIRVVVAHNCCPACLTMEGTYKKEMAPSLPIEGCSHPLGCRCFYEPMLLEIYP